MEVLGSGVTWLNDGGTVCSLVTAVAVDLGLNDGSSISCDQIQINFRLK
jgi:hypothetical protein